MSRTLRISRDLKLLEKYCNTTADKIRAKIKRQREQQQRQREQQQRQREQKQMSFQEAQQEEPGLTLGEYQADLFLKDLAAGKVKFAPLHTEERGPPVTASEYKATAGGRKTRRKRRRKRKKRGGYGPGITAEEARQMRIREERRREAERQQEIREAEAAATRARELREQREADTIRRANELMPNRDITGLSEAQQIIDEHERHRRLMYDLIPVAKETRDVPHAIKAKRSLGSYILGSSKIPTADVVDEENIPMAVEAKMQRVGGKKTRKKKKRKRKRRKKHKKTRRK